MFLTQVSTCCPSCWPKVLWHTVCASATCALKFQCSWLGQQSKQAHWEDQRGGQVHKRERKIRRAVCSFTLIFFIAMLDSRGKWGDDYCLEESSPLDLLQQLHLLVLRLEEQHIWHLLVLSRVFLGKGRGFWRFWLCFTLGVEYEGSSIGLVSASPHGCFTPGLIRALSLICLCLGQTSLCVFCSGSSLPHWPQTMSGREQ